MNQILISEKIYVTREMRKKRKAYRILYMLSILTLIALLVYYVYAEKNRNDQEALGQEILEQLGDETTVEEGEIVISLDENENNNEDAQAVEPIPEEETEHSTPPASTVTTSNGSTYNTESVLIYPKLGISYPVLSEESDALLKVSLCKYWGPSPNQVGNYCIVGHNYKSGKMFGKLSASATGDEVQLKDLAGNIVKYSVYNRYIVEPTDVSCTSQLTNGKRELTLITCTNYGKQRLVVKAREI